MLVFCVVCVCDVCCFALSLTCTPLSRPHLPQRQRVGGRGCGDAHTCYHVISAHVCGADGYPDLVWMPHAQVSNSVLCPMDCKCTSPLPHSCSRSQRHWVRGSVSAHQRHPVWAHSHHIIRSSSRFFREPGADVGVLRGVRLRRFVVLHSLTWHAPLTPSPPQRQRVGGHKCGDAQTCYHVISAHVCGADGYPDSVGMPRSSEWFCVVPN
jgi:hypothetical protein